MNADVNDALKTYSDIGFSVIPVKVSVDRQSGKNLKKPLTKWQQYQNKKPSYEELQQTFYRYSQAGVGIVTGKISNLLVLDIDDLESIDLSRIPETPTVRTISGGLHAYFKYPKDLEARNTTGLWPGVDIRAEGGFVVAPPTRSGEGSYTWVKGLDVPIAELPGWLSELLTMGNKVNNSKVDYELMVPAGRRHPSALSFIGYVTTKFSHESYEDLWQRVLDFANKKFEVPFDEKNMIWLRETFDRYAPLNIQKAQSNDSDEKKKSKDSQSKALINYIRENAVIFQDQFKEACIVYPANGFIAQRLSDKKTQHLLSKIYWDLENHPPSSQAISTAISVLQGIALYDIDKEVYVHNRIGRHDSSLYYDIGDNQHIIKVSASGWSVETTSPIPFYRYSHQKEQVFPQKGGDLKQFLKYVNVIKPNDQLLLLTNLVVSFFPDIPRVVLLIHGSQGSGKSTQMVLQRRLIDPTAIEYISFPKDQEALAQIASHNYVVYFDNLSSLSQWASDAISRIVTGDGLTKRSHYTDDDDFIYKFMRAVGINGINQVANRSDLLSRSIIVTTEVIDERRRGYITEHLESFEQEKPKILGAIFDCLVYCLKNSKHLSLKFKPRMADYYREAAAVAKFLGYPEIALIEAFQINTQRQNQEALESSSVAQVLINFMKTQEEIWYGSATSLYMELKKLADELGIKKSFPSNPNWLWKEIERVIPNLIIFGLDAKRGRASEFNWIKLIKDPEIFSKMNNLQGSGDVSGGSGSILHTSAEDVISE